MQLYTTWYPIEKLPKFESHILALFHNGSFQTVFIWAAPWSRLIEGSKATGKMICWSYLPDDLELNGLLEHFKK